MSCFGRRMPGYQPLAVGSEPSLALISPSTLPGPIEFQTASSSAGALGKTSCCGTSASGPQVETCFIAHPRGVPGDPERGNGGHRNGRTPPGPTNHDVPRLACAREWGPSDCRGESTISIFSEGRYVSVDIEGRTGPPGVNPVLKRWGFGREGRHFRAGRSSPAHRVSPSGDRRGTTPTGVEDVSSRCGLSVQVPAGDRRTPSILSPLPCDHGGSGSIQPRVATSGRSLHGDSENLPSVV